MPKVAVSASDRAREFESDGLYSSDKQTVFCKFCNCSLAWDRRDTVTKHVQSEKHKGNKIKFRNIPAIRQTSLAGCIQASKKKKEDSEYLAQRTVETFLKANIPLHKLENEDFRHWMIEFMQGAGNIPCVKTLREKYVPSIEERRLKNVVEQLADKDVVVLADETTDSRGRCVFAVLLKTNEGCSDQKLFVGSVKFLETADSTQCARAILGALQKYNINYDKVKAIVSDSARYMNKCIESLKVIIGDHVFHVQCWAHKLNLVANIFAKELGKLNSAVSHLKSAFLNTRKRKHMYLQFLREKNRAVKGFPLPVLTRWNSWLSSVMYVAEYLEVMIEFFRSEEIRDLSNAGIEYINSLSVKDIDTVLVEAMFVKEHASDLMRLIEHLEISKFPTSHELYSRLKELEDGFALVGNGTFDHETNRLIYALKNQVLQAEVKDILKRTGLQLQTKLATLVSKDPSRSLFKVLDSCFSHKMIVLNPINDDLAQKIATLPGFTGLSNLDILKGYKALQNAVEEHSQSSLQPGNFNIIRCLLATKEYHHQFATAAMKAVWLPCSNTDSERLFSQYSEVLTDRRHNLTEDNLEIMTMLSFENNSC